MSKSGYGSVQFNRSVSIFANKKQFNTDNAELNFAKDYNKKLYHPDSFQKSLTQRQFLDIKSGFKDDKHKEILKENLKNNSLLKFNSPTYRRENPLTFEGKTFKQERNKKGMTPFSNIDNISYDTTKTEHAWKPCIKKIEIKLSDNMDEVQKRQLKSTEISQLQNSNLYNPIFGGLEKQNFRTSTGGNGDQKISQSYQKVASIKLELPSQRRLEQNIFGTKSEVNLSKPKPIEKCKTSALNTMTSNSAKKANIQSLLSYGYAPDFKYKDVATKPNLVEKTELNLKRAENELQKDFKKKKSQFTSYKKW